MVDILFFYLFKIDKVDAVRGVWRTPDSIAIKIFIYIDFQYQNIFFYDIKKVQ